jgi:hypothetical protein
VVSDLTYSGTWAHESEMALAFELIDFQDVIIQVLKDLSPNGLCNYLRVIVGLFTAFYTNCPVMKVPRLALYIILTLNLSSILFIFALLKCYMLHMIYPPSHFRMVHNLLRHRLMFRKMFAMTVSS